MKKIKTFEIERIRRDAQKIKTMPFDVIFNDTLREIYMFEVGTDDITDKSIDLERIYDNPLSSKNRICIKWINLLYDYVPDPTDTIVVCFKANRKTSSAIYGFLYSRIIPGVLPGKKPTKSDITHDYVDFSPTYNSQDGEYRGGLIEYMQYNKDWYDNEKLFEDIEKYFFGKKNDLTFQVDLFYPRGFTDNDLRKEYEDTIDTQRFAIKLFVCSWLCSYVKFANGVLENHINAAYMLTFINEDQMEFYESLQDKYTQKFIDKLAADLQCIRYARQLSNNVAPQIGQKIVPLTIRETMEPNNIMYGIWRELYISKLCARLPLNFISPSFPLVMKSLYVQNMHPGIFDNMAMHTKYKYSDVAKDMQTSLKVANSKAYSREKEPLNDKFWKASHKIEAAIKFADAYIRLGNVGLCMFTEYVGRTLRDMPALCAHYREKDITSYKIFDVYDNFMCHLFEFIYAAHCMNTKLYVIHGDLHLNNMTIYDDKSSVIHKIHEVPTPVHLCKLYNIGTGDENLSYIFQHTGQISAIIDFSRAIFVDISRLKTDFDEGFADMYLTEQANRIISGLSQFFEKFIRRHRLKLDAFLRLNPRLFFKAICGMDAISITAGMLHMLENDDVFRKKMIIADPRIIPTLKSINDKARISIMDNLSGILSGAITEQNQITWTNGDLIAQYFADYTSVSPKYNARWTHRPIVTTVFNYENEVKWNLDKYANLGPFLSLDIRIDVINKLENPSKKNEEELLEAQLCVKRIQQEPIESHMELITQEYASDVSTMSESWTLM